MQSDLPEGVQGERIRSLNARSEMPGDFILYWMQASQRAFQNPALEYAAHRSASMRKPLLVYFGLDVKYPRANARHVAFMIQGLKDVQTGLGEREIEFVIGNGPPAVGAARLSRHACLVVADSGYTRAQRTMRGELASHVSCPLIQVEGNVVVPVMSASEKEEYSAGTFRPKLTRLLNSFMQEVPEVKPARGRIAPHMKSIELAEMKDDLGDLDVDRSVAIVASAKGGEERGRATLKRFVREGLEDYAASRDDPGIRATSGLSPYLHFGQISPVEAALAVRDADAAGTEGFLDELLVRRELAVNYAFYNQNHESYRGIPAWASGTLSHHARDKREKVYSLKELEWASTDDPYWNAAQRELLHTGSMHGHMRMYWGKRIIAWTRWPKDAFSMAVYLNDKYQLDGRDPNGYAGIAWCFGKHDRPWPEREVYGMVRPMTPSGLERKYDMEKYIKRVGSASRAGRPRPS